ncbi:hypothetical protein FBEOM_13126 [Fusarium beomiforme]|uniref:Uncharacterized protein n=1 Tax=Fusarium beomiforme TaxID=44412 RepID=A0A9P5DRV7_9HYPO|nr:hypothetical protein FBEOM_13126 [Fusarium beomiforme]
MDSPTPNTDSVRLKAMALAEKISQAWATIVTSHDQAGLQELRLLLAGHDGWLSDLQDEEKAAAEDKTICVQGKRKRSLSPDAERKRHCKQKESNKPPASEGSTDGNSTPEICHDAPVNGSINTLQVEAGPLQLETSAIQPKIQPKAGDVYCIYHEESQRRLAAVILPLANPCTIGISGTMETLGLSMNVPNCVVFNVNSGQLEWRDGYRDGEASSHARKYPVIYVTGRNFPETGAVGWVSTKDLQVLDELRLRASGVPFYRTVRAYLERRTLCQTFQARLGDFETPSVGNSRDLGSHGSSSFFTGDPLAAPNVYLMGPDKSRFSCGQSSWSAQSYGRFIMRGHLRKAPIPPHRKLPAPRPTNPNLSPERKMPSTLNLPDSCRLTGFAIGKYAPKATTLPPLNTLKDFAFGAQLGLFEWPEELSPRILSMLSRKLKVQGIEPLPIDFKNSQGKLECPLCFESKGFIQLQDSRSNIPRPLSEQVGPDKERPRAKRARHRRDTPRLTVLTTTLKPSTELDTAPSMLSPSSLNAPSPQRDHNEKHSAQACLFPQEPRLDLVSQSIEEFIRESQYEVSYFASAENSERTYELLLDLLDGDAVGTERREEEARWTDGAEWLSLLESGRKDRKKGTICYAITAIAFARWHATQMQLVRDDRTNQQASQQVSARILNSYSDNDISRREKQRKSLNTHLTRGRKWLRKLAKSPESVVNEIIEVMPYDEKKLTVLRLLGGQMRLLLRTGKTNSDLFRNDLEKQGLASPRAVLTPCFTQLQEIQDSVTGDELLVKDANYRFPVGSLRLLNGQQWVNQDVILACLHLSDRLPFIRVGSM